MVKANLILVGAGGHSRSCIDAIEQQGNYTIGGLVGLSQEVSLDQFGYKVLATDSELGELARKFPYALISLGQITSPEIRIHLFEKALELGFIFPTIIVPSAYVSPYSTIGAGTIIMQGAIVNAGAVIGENCIINSRAVVEHDSRVESHCHISTGVILNGNTTIGKGSFIGSGATIKEGVSIGAGSLVGMGLAVRHDLVEHSKFLGTRTS